MMDFFFRLPLGFKPCYHIFLCSFRLPLHLTSKRKPHAPQCKGNGPSRGGNGGNKTKEADFKKKLAAKPFEYKGVAMNLSKVKLNTWSIETSPVHEIEAKALGLQQWTLEKAKSGTFFSDFNLPLVVHDAKSMPKDGEWRKFGLDKDVYPFFDRWYDVKETSANDLGYTVEEKNLMLDTFKHACCHWPVHIYFIELSPDIELKIFIKSMDIIQKFRSDEEKHADSGWETCCHVARARATCARRFRNKLAMT